VANRVLGTDLGVSVHFGNDREDIIYYGDTTLPPFGSLKKGPEYLLRHECAYKTELRCNDAYGKIDDADPTDGVNVELQAMSYAHLDRKDRISKWIDGFASIRLMGLNTTDLDGRLISKKQGNDIFDEYNAPSGAMAITAYLEAGSGEPFFEQEKVARLDSGQEFAGTSGVLLFFATANNVYSKKRSWYGCSIDGVTFRSCAYPKGSAVTPLSRDKFIQVAPVPFSRDDVDQVCEEDPVSMFCGLGEVLSDFRPDAGQGALLFGNGKYYRCSPLYLAYLELTTGKIFYYSGTSGNEWSANEGDAVAIIEPDVAGFNPENQKSCPFEPDSKTAAASNYIFGEVSITRVNDYFVMLSNHATFSNDKTPFGRIYYRTARIESPDIWSEPVATSAVGYGPYIMDRYTEIKGGNFGQELIVYHVLSIWNPEFVPEEPYAANTKQLLLLKTGRPPQWPPID
jgi:hypothetical protein